MPWYCLHEIAIIETVRERKTSPAPDSCSERRPVFSVVPGRRPAGLVIDLHNIRHIAGVELRGSADLHNEPSFLKLRLMMGGKRDSSPRSPLPTHSAEKRRVSGKHPPDPRPKAVRQCDYRTGSLRMAGNVSGIFITPCARKAPARRYKVRTNFCFIDNPESTRSLRAKTVALQRSS